MNIFENSVLQILFMPLSFIYGLIIRLRNFCYDNGLFAINIIDGCKIIGVGNISVGGTGKTPVVKFIADYLVKKNLKVVVLSRGYGRESKGTVIVSDGNKILTDFETAGDEPLLLANQLKKVPVIVEADRVKGARFIVDKFAPDVILLDDAYQHRKIFRDLNIVLIDASRGFGNNKLLPSGFLREPISNLKRADLVWLTRVDSTENLNHLQTTILKYSKSPQVTSAHVPTALIQMKNNKSYDLSFLKDKKIVLFSGIANQASFYKVVKNLGAVVTFEKEFSDHYHYSTKDLKRIITLFTSTNSDLILTTEKDYYRIASQVSYLEHFYYLTVEINIIDGYETLNHNLTSLF